MSGWSWICSESDRVSSGARTTTANRAERTRAVCDGLRAALAAYGVPEQILTDNAKVFTGRFFHPPVEVLLDRICRENGIEHLLTAPRSPTTTGKIERSHRSLRAEFLSQQPSFTNLKTAQQALGEWVDYYNTVRPPQSLHMATPREKFTASPAVSPSPAPQPLGSDRYGDDWVSRRVTANGVVCVLATGQRRSPPCRRGLAKPRRRSCWEPRMMRSVSECSS